VGLAAPSLGKELLWKGTGTVWGCPMAVVGAALELQGRWRVSRLASISIRAVRLKESKENGTCHSCSQRKFL